MDYLDRVVALLESHNHLGERVLSNGTRLIGHVPHVAPEAWLHEIFAPLGADDVARLEDALGIEMPGCFTEFLKRANGLRVFSGHLYICGLRTNYVRTGEAVRQPFSILTPNLDERPARSKETYFFIGGHEPNGHQFYIDRATLRVYRCSERSAKPLQEWPSFEAMLEAEVQRLSALFDREGRSVTGWRRLPADDH